MNYGDILFIIHIYRFTKLKKNFSPTVVSNVMVRFFPPRGGTALALGALWRIASLMNNESVFIN